MRRSAEKLSQPERQKKIQAELQKAVLGQQPGGPQTGSAHGLTSSTENASSIPELACPRGSKPLSLWDWEIWTKARPTLWQYGDAGNLDPKRSEAPLLTDEWITAMCIREEMIYTIEGEEEEFQIPSDEWPSGINRFAGDWVTLHLFKSLFWLVERHQSAFSFLKNGGLKWAEKVRHLTPEALASSSRLAAGGGGIKAILNNKNVPQLVREALNAMQMAFADVLGTDGHRRLCRHEGVAYMSLFGPPVIFCTPNLADSKQPLLLVVQGEEIRLDEEMLACVDLPKYRDMMRRLARDPVGQTRVFEVMMRLFFIHVLGVRPDCLQNRRRNARAPREWCTDGVAASASAPGIFGPVHAFRGEIEAQGRGSLHPHILVWLINISSLELLRILQRDPVHFKERLRTWMRATVQAVQSTTQSSVKSLPRQFGDAETLLPDLPFSHTERAMSRYDGGSELDVLRAEQARGVELSDNAQWVLDNEANDTYCRPCLPLRDADGVELLPNAPVKPRDSVYKKRLHEFAVSECPKYRRLGTLRNSSSDASNDALAPQEPQAPRIEGLGSDDWRDRFGADVRRLATEVLIHICGESCYKYSGAKMTQICRHGFYHVVAIEDWQRRWQGKPLRNAVYVIRQTKHGMKGRLLLFQEHPFECQSNYAALPALRCNFDMQDLRRVLSTAEWLDSDVPHLGNRPDFGYMNAYEWDGEAWVPRSECESAQTDIGDAPHQWQDRESLENWREILLGCLQEDSRGDSPDVDETGLQFEREIIGSFSDGISTGFYINAYTTKHCPTMEGVLEEMRRGLERLHSMREEARTRYQENLQARAAASAQGSTSSDADPVPALKKRTVFGDALEVLKRLSSSYRRCYWKSGSEMLFPIFYGHLTFASHRCWTVFIKKGVYLASEAWRRQFGRAVRHAALQDGGGAILQYNRAGMDPYPLVGWKRIASGNNSQAYYEGPNGEVCEDLKQAFETEMASKHVGGDVSEAKVHLSVLQRFLNDCSSEREQRRLVTEARMIRFFRMIGRLSSCSRIYHPVEPG